MDCLLLKSVRGLENIKQRYNSFFKEQNCYDLTILPENKTFRRIQLSGLESDSFYHLSMIENQSSVICFLLKGNVEVEIHKGRRRIVHDIDSSNLNALIIPGSWEYRWKITPSSNISDVFVSSPLEYLSKDFKLYKIDDDDLNDIETTSDHSNLIYSTFCLDFHECNAGIEYFNNNDSKQTAGATYGGIDSMVKNTTDVMIYDNNVLMQFYKDRLLKEINNYLLSVAPSHLQKLIDDNSIVVQSMQIQHYVKNEGHYIKHVDGIDTNRILAFIWYLNDVDVGGETCFYNDTKNEIRIKPEMGKLIIFPTGYTFIHSGMTPLSNDKYILTGWIDIKNYKSSVVT